MSERRKSADWPVVAAVVLVLVVVIMAGYPGAYVALSQLGGPYLATQGEFYERGFRSGWQLTMFRPAAMVEGWLRGCPVIPCDLSDLSQRHERGDANLAGH